MNEIICPHCKKSVKIDEAGYADILKQVHNHQFEEELQKRLDIAEHDKATAVKLAEANLRNSLQQELSVSSVKSVDGSFEFKIFGIGTETTGQIENESAHKITLKLKPKKRLELKNNKN